MSLLFYYKPLFRPRGYEVRHVEDAVLPKKRRKKKSYEIVGTTSTAFAKDSNAEEVKRWKEIKAALEAELKSIEGEILSLAEKEALKRRLELKLAREARKLSELQSVKARAKAKVQNRQAADFIKLTSIIVDKLLERTVAVKTDELPKEKRRMVRKGGALSFYDLLRLVELANE